jgi:hypothetical protein
MIDSNIFALVNNRDDYRGGWNLFYSLYFELKK